MKYPEKIKAYNRQHSMDEDDMITLWRKILKNPFQVLWLVMTEVCT